MNIGVLPCQLSISTFVLGKAPLFNTNSIKSMHCVWQAILIILENKSEKEKCRLYNYQSEVQYSL
jgi:succinylglutamate desuccinylase